MAGALPASSFENLGSDVMFERIAEQEAMKAAPKNASKGKAKKSAPPPPPPPPDVERKESEEEKAIRKEIEARERQGMLDKIMNYRERFKHIKKRNNVSGKSSWDELADELHYIEAQLGAQPENNAAAIALIAGCYGIEQVNKQFNPLGLDLTGLGTTVKGNIEQFEDILDELVIKYNMGMYMGPETRLVLLLTATVATVHAANSGNTQIAATLDKVADAADQAKGKKDVSKRYDKL